MYGPLGIKEVFQKSRCGHATDVTSPEPSRSVSCNNAVDYISDSERDNSEHTQPRPRPTQTRHDAKHSIGPDESSASSYENDGVEVNTADAVL